MAASLITRSNLTDDDGSGTTGSIWNQATLQAIYDAIDLLTSGTGSYSTLSFGGRVRAEGAGFAAKGIAAPAVSAASEGGFYFDSTRKIWLQSMNASAWQPIVTTLDKTTTEQDVVSSTTDTNVWSFTVKGGLIGTAGMLRLSVLGDYLNNTGVNQNLFVTVKYGGTIIAGGPSGTGVAFGGGNYATDTNRHPFLLQTLFNANGATNSQRAVTSAFMGTASATETDWGIIITDNRAMKSNLAIDTTADQTMLVSVQHGTSNANLSFRRFAVVLELIG